VSNTKPTIPGEAGVWVMITGDAILFSLLFGLFMRYRGEELSLFATSQANLNQLLGLLNTLLMLSSSWLVASGVHAARVRMVRQSSMQFGAAALCGIGFMVVKYFEYSSKIHAGITLSTNNFFMLYYVYTGIHLIHVVLGTGVLITMAWYVRSGGICAVKIRNLESGASFWHLVDMLWIVLFALLYLVH
jgi:nitric oxide reductase NorE protein